MLELPSPATLQLPQPATHHAPAERVGRDQLRALVEAVHESRLIQALLDSYPDVVVLLDAHRQIVACNAAVVRLLGVGDPEDLVGERVGEVLSCVHAREMPGGCGTSEHCQNCGAVNAMLRCQATGAPASDDCRITTGDPQAPQAWDLHTVAAPLSLAGQNLIIFTARDVSAARRREALERLFFHDILNIATGLEGLAEQFAIEHRCDHAPYGERLTALSRQLVEQIRAHRDLAAAEQGELEPRWETVAVSDLFHTLRATYETHPVARHCRLVFHTSQSAPALFESDPVLLTRVLGNLIKNALEASHPGQTVTVALAGLTPDDVTFTVHNEDAMPPQVRLQVFQRSFSTKGGIGRGLGTFSVKLLTGRYLGGTVDFRSQPETGTTFTVTLPRCRTPDWSPDMALSTAADTNRRLDDMHVLIAEDDADNARLLAHLIKKAGATVVTAGDGQAAINCVAATARPFDVILMDVSMPGVDGLTATRQLRQQGHAMPILALTAFGADEDRHACIAAGCDQHVEKPVDRRTLLHLLSTYRATGRSA